MIIGVEGPSYRPVGAIMAVNGDGTRVGSLSSGCVEGDIAAHAGEALAQDAPRELRYGRGSPFMDIQLPCGGGLDIALIPKPDASALAEVARHRAARIPCVLQINLDTGAMEVLPDGETGRDGPVFRVRFEPEIRFLVFGKGPEASTFAALVQSAGFPNLLLSPDPETRDSAEEAGCPTQAIYRPDFPEDLQVDPWTAIVLFLHDHEWEPPILAPALTSNAFYIGAQGSQRARDARAYELIASGVDKDDLARLRGPIGLIPSARDARLLAVSVLAEVLDEARLLAAQGNAPA